MLCASDVLFIYVIPLFDLFSLQENPNCLLIVTPKGGHLGWAAGAGAPLGAPWTDPVVMDFLDHLERRVSQPGASLSKDEDRKQDTENLHCLEV